MRTLTVSLLGAALAVALAVPAAQAGEGVRDFERGVKDAGAEAGAKPGAARTRSRTVTINPHQPFDLVGFRWKSGTPRIMVQSYGLRGWSDWAEAHHDPDHAPDSAPDSAPGGDGPAREQNRALTSDPVWTGPAYMIRLRITGAVRGLRAHFVDLKPGELRTLASSAGSGGVAPGTSAPSPGTTTPSPGSTPPTTGDKADATAPPPYVTREQWGANTRCKPKYSASYGEVLGAVVHHTVSTNTYSQAEAPGVVLAICRYHRYSNGWSDVGYNALIDRFGTLYEGRAGGMARAVGGAHAGGFNGQTTGVALIGNHMTTPAPAEAMATLRTWLGWKLAQHGVARNERVLYMSVGGSATPFRFGKFVSRRPISGHRDLDSTTCPGNSLYGEIDGLNSTLLTPSNRLVTRLSIRARRGAPGSSSVYLTGRLRGAGKLLKGKTMLVQYYGEAGWTTLERAETDQDGIYRATVPLTKRVYLRVAFGGDGDYRHGRSGWKYAPKLP